MYLKKAFRIGKTPWENLLAFQNYLNCSMEAARRYFKGFDAACWQTSIIVEQKPVWAPEPAVLKLSLQDSVIFIRAHFAWLRNLGLLSIKALKNEGKNFNQETWIPRPKNTMWINHFCSHAFVVSVRAGELTAYLGKYSEHVTVAML